MLNSLMMALPMNSTAQNAIAIRQPIHSARAIGAKNKMVMKIGMNAIAWSYSNRVNRRDRQGL